MSIKGIGRSAAASVQESWHRDLLETAKNEGIIEEELSLALEIPRKFRHKFRRAYGFMLEWSMMREAFFTLPSITMALGLQIDKPRDKHQGG